MTDHPTHPWQFATAQEALFWSCDVLRARSLPKLSSLWREIVHDAEGARPPVELEEGAYRISRNSNLPTHPLERMGLALAVARHLDAMEVQGELLRLHALGDWVDDAHLRGALRMQEKLRRQGESMRLSYRLSLRQLGQALGREKKTVSKHLHRAFAQLAKRLDAAGLLHVPESDDGAPVRQREQVDVRRFRDK
ncbi:MAG: hypothetical protein H6922_00585 [Pseudomonadaceae bacterium]|nr:hypothetical protein [Pseudomonadaceae bacterium]